VAIMLRISERTAFRELAAGRAALALALDMDAGKDLGGDPRTGSTRVVGPRTGAGDRTGAIASAKTWRADNAVAAGRRRARRTHGE
jgi:hypothetical protein